MDAIAFTRFRKHLSESVEAACDTGEPLTATRADGRDVVDAENRRSAILCRRHAADLRPRKQPAPARLILRRSGKSPGGHRLNSRNCGVVQRFLNVFSSARRAARGRSHARNRAGSGRCVWLRAMRLSTHRVFRWLPCRIPNRWAESGIGGRARATARAGRRGSHRRADVVPGSWSTDETPGKAA